jgi:hypothetical protein
MSRMLELELVLLLETHFYIGRMGLRRSTDAKVTSELRSHSSINLQSDRYTRRLPRPSASSRALENAYFAP